MATDRSNELPPMAELLGMRLTGAGEGRAEMRVRPGPQHGNSRGLVHGGLAATLIDTVTGSAVWSVVPDTAVIATVDLDVTYVRAVTSDVDELVGTAEVLHAGNRVAVARADVHGTDGTLYATGKATYAVRRGA